ncbi:MAG: hypothetical protein ACTHNU_04630 [Gaiellales bacterium]
MTTTILLNLGLCAGVLGLLAAVMSLPKPLSKTAEARSQETHTRLRRDSQPLDAVFEV